MRPAGCLVTVLTRTVVTTRITCWWEQYHWWGRPFAWWAAGPCYPRRQHTACTIALTTYKSFDLLVTLLYCLSPFYLAWLRTDPGFHQRHTWFWSIWIARPSTHAKGGYMFDCALWHDWNWFGNVRQQVEICRKGCFSSFSCDMNWFGNVRQRVEMCNNNCSGSFK